MKTGNGSHDTTTPSRSAIPDEKDGDGLKGNGGGKHNQPRSSDTSDSTRDRRPQIKGRKASLEASETSSTSRGQERDAQKGKIEHDSRKRDRSRSYSSDGSANDKARDEKRPFQA